MYRRVKADRLELEAVQYLDAPPEKVFPLLCPAREHEWLAGWACEVIHTASGVAEQDCIFATVDPESGGRDIWVVSRHRPPAEIEFVRVSPRRSIRYTIALQGDERGGTTATWRQVVTSLDGRKLTGVDQRTFAAMVANCETALNHFLATGRPLNSR